jgi:hypothetical protein
MKDRRIHSDNSVTPMSYLSRAMMLYEADDDCTASTSPPSVSEASSSSRSDASNPRVPSRLRSYSMSTNSTHSSSSANRIRNRPKSSLRLRSNLLYKLGVVPNPPQKLKSTASASILGNAVEYTELTKFGEEDPCTATVFSFDETEYEQLETPKSGRRKIQFNEDVNVMPIPMRTEYSSRIKKRLWSGNSEIFANAQRNTLEFAYEGWDWRSVKEEAQFSRSVESGHLLHPVHCQQPRIDTQFNTISSAQHSVMN